MSFTILNNTLRILYGSLELATGATAHLLHSHHSVSPVFVRKLTRAELPSTQDLFRSRVRKCAAIIFADPTHPGSYRTCQAEQTQLSRQDSINKRKTSSLICQWNFEVNNCTAGLFLGTMCHCKNRNKNYYAIIGKDL